MENATRVHLRVMTKVIITLALWLAVSNLSAQQVNLIPTHYLHRPQFREKLECPAYIDSTLFSEYLDWNLQKDSLPPGVNLEEGFEKVVYYVVSKEGRITFAKVAKKHPDNLELFILKILIACPYQWLPAYQNGRAVNSYHRLRIVF